MVFCVQKVGFCIAKVWFLFFKRVFFVLQYTIPCPRNTPKWRCDTSYRTHEHPQNGITIHHTTPPNTHKMALQFSTVGIAMPLFLFIVPHVLPRSPRRRRDRFIVPVPTKFHEMALRIPIVDIAIHYTAPTKFHKMALQFI